MNSFRLPFLHLQDGCKDLRDKSNCSSASAAKVTGVGSSVSSDLERGTLPWVKLGRAQSPRQSLGWKRWQAQIACSQGRGPKLSKSPLRPAQLPWASQGPLSQIPNSSRPKPGPPEAQPARAPEGEGACGPDDGWPSPSQC